MSISGWTAAAWRGEYRGEKILIEFDNTESSPFSWRLQSKASGRADSFEEACNEAWGEIEAQQRRNGTPEWLPQVEDKVRVILPSNKELDGRIGTVATFYKSSTGCDIVGVCFRGYANHPISFSLDTVEPVNEDGEI